MFCKKCYSQDENHDCPISEVVYRVANEAYEEMCDASTLKYPKAVLARHIQKLLNDFTKPDSEGAV